MRIESAAHEPKAPEIEGQIEGLRSELDELVGELDRRRHEAMDVRLQIRRHPRVAGVVLALAALTVVGRLTVLRRRRFESLSSRAVNLARALAVISEQDPARVRRLLEGRPNPTAIGALARAGAALMQSRIARRSRAA
jgi:hypothetical protein